MYYASNRQLYYLNMLGDNPQAVADIRGNTNYPETGGTALFFQTHYGVLVYEDLFGLPAGEGACKEKIFAVTIHDSESCNGADSETLLGSELNPGNCPAPFRIGDLPPIFAQNGYSFAILLTGRFFVKDIIGKIIVIHQGPELEADEVTAGNIIACGKIIAFDK